MFTSSRNRFALGLAALLLMLSVQDAGAGDGHWKHRHGRGHDTHDWRSHPGRGHGPPHFAYTSPRVVYVPRPLYVGPPPVLYVPREPSVSIILPIDIR